MADMFEIALTGGTNIFAASGLENIRNCLCAIAATRVAPYLCTVILAQTGSG